MKEVKVVSYKEVGFNYNVCDEIFENGTGMHVEGRFIDIGFWKEVFEDWLEWNERPLMIKHINEMANNIWWLNDEILVEF